jgi:hypothetical protein
MGKIVVAEERATKCLKVADQREGEALFLDSGLIQGDHGTNSGCPPLMIDERTCIY